MIGFRPARLPPIGELDSGVPIGHIQTGHWAQRVGLKVGDFITHVNGRAVKSMANGDDFIQAMTHRPLKLTIQVSISGSELTEILQTVDWKARFKNVEKVREAANSDPKETNEIFDRVFSAPPVADDKSPLFDFSKWLGSKPDTEPEPETLGAGPIQSAANLVQIGAPTPPSVDTPSPLPPPIAPPAERKNKTNHRTLEPPTKMWVPSYPLCVWVTVEQGFDLPDRAGTLGLDYYMQPFRPDPYVQLSLVASPSSEVTMNEILDAKPIEKTADLETAVCDANSKWNYTGTLVVGSTAFTEKNVMLVGRLMDYRRLEAARPMGVFAIRLTDVEIADEIAKVTPSLVTLTTVDAVTFDVSKTKLKISMCLRGEQVTQLSGLLKSRPGTGATSGILGCSQSSTSSSADQSRVNTPPAEHVEPPVVAVAQQPQPIVYHTPFQRAYQKAMSDIRQGDTSPIRLQHYTLR